MPSESFATIAAQPVTSSRPASGEQPLMTPPTGSQAGCGRGLLWVEFQKGGDPRVWLSFTYSTIFKTMLGSTNAQDGCVLGFTLKFQCCYTLGIDKMTKREINSPHFMANKHMD